MHSQMRFLLTISTFVKDVDASGYGTNYKYGF
jgi:hypothetical protein